MKIAIFSKSPLAAAPLELFKALRRHTRHEVSLINMSANYKDGRSFPYHLLFRSDNGNSRKALQEADIWHIHNYLAYEIKPYRQSKKVMAQFHSLPRMGNWQELMRYADRCYTIRQPNQEKEYQLPALPNVIDPDEYRPEPRPGKIRIAFAPSSRAPVGRPMSKGYKEVREILNKVAAKRDVTIEWIEGIPYEENLKRKARSHILIDDVVTGNFHRTALEGSCFGCVVMSSFKCDQFHHSTLASLEEDLLQLIDVPILRREYQTRARLWVLQKWHAMDQVKEYEAAYEGVINGK